MNETTLEQYFIEDYKRLKAENDDLKAKLAAFEANAGNHEYGITDLHQRSKAVKGSVISDYYVNIRLRDGKLKEDTARSWLEMSDADLFKKVNDKSVDYSTLLKLEEHEFQYTLFVKESRTEWVSVCDGNRDSKLETVDEGDFCEDTWFSIDRADEFKAWLLGEFRYNLREGLERYEAWKEENGGAEG